MPKNSRVTVRIGPVAPVLQIAKYPAWTTLPQSPIYDIQADHRVETDIDATGVGRVRVKPGYNVNVDEIRYVY